jgi:hypothetical protein
MQQTETYASGSENDKEIRREGRMYPAARSQRRTSGN